MYFYKFLRKIFTYTALIFSVWVFLFFLISNCLFNFYLYILLSNTITVYSIFTKELIMYPNLKTIKIAELLVHSKGILFHPKVL